jgi:hypothetical protein
VSRACGEGKPYFRKFLPEKTLKNCMRGVDFSVNEDQWKGLPVEIDYWIEGEPAPPVNKDTITRSFEGHRELPQNMLVGSLPENVMFTVTREGDHRSMEGWTQYHAAAEAGDMPTLRHLWRGSAALNAQDAEGETPLHCAVKFAQTDAVELLLNLGAAVDIEDHENRMPLDLVRRVDQISCLRLLVDAGAPIGRGHARKALGVVEVAV